VTDVAGNVADWPVPFYVKTPALPPWFPPLHTTTHAASGMEPGLTLIPTIYMSPLLPGTGSYVILVDGEGKVVWYYATRERIRDVTRLRNGNFLCLHADERQAFELDPLGNIVQKWWAANLGTTGAPQGSTMVAVDTIHHELDQLPPGEQADFIGLSSSHRLFPDYPTSEMDPTQTEAVGHVAGTVVFEMQRDGTVVRSCDLLDVLDPYRMCYGSLASVYSVHYGQHLRDWSHANSVILDRSDDTWIVSVRHQDAIVKIRRSDHSIVWIHGSHERWNKPWSDHLLHPVGIPFDWHFHQHAAQLDPSGRMTLFDNGNFDAIPPTPAASAFSSRAVAYQLDPITHSTQEVWSWDGAGQPFYSGSLGAAFPLPITGNVLLTAGNIRVTGQNRSYAMIQEVSGTMPSELRFELIVNDPSLPNPSPYNWTVYRTRRVTSIYPHH
jgi:arylsulfate sulfotransferase